MQCAEGCKQTESNLVISFKLHRTLFCATLQRAERLNRFGDDGKKLAIEKKTKDRNNNNKKRRGRPGNGGVGLGFLVTAGKASLSC